MKRRIFTFFSALSLLVCIAACVLWVRSYRGGEMFDVECDEQVTPGHEDADGAFYGTTCNYRIIELLSDRGGVEFEIGVGAGPGTD